MYVKDIYKIYKTLICFGVCVCVWTCSVTQLYLTLCNPMDSSLPGSSIHGIFLARVLEWVAISFSRLSSWPRDWTWVSSIPCIGRQILYHCTSWEALCFDEKAFCLFPFVYVTLFQDFLISQLLGSIMCLLTNRVSLSILRSAENPK